MLWTHTDEVIPFMREQIPGLTVFSKEEIEQELKQQKEIPAWFSNLQYSLATGYTPQEALSSLQYLLEKVVQGKTHGRMMDTVLHTNSVGACAYCFSVLLDLYPGEETNDSR